jgi:predicted ArsR family transcriptional regulator
MAQFMNNNKDGSSHILECHSPILNLVEEYPTIGRFEQDMFEAVLGTRVRRQVIRNSGLYECIFQFAL